MSADGKGLNLALFKTFGEDLHHCMGMNLALLGLAFAIARGFSGGGTEKWQPYVYFNA